MQVALVQLVQQLSNDPMFEGLTPDTVGAGWKEWKNYFKRNFKSDAISYKNTSVSMPVAIVQLVEKLTNVPNAEGLNLATAGAG